MAWRLKRNVKPSPLPKSPVARVVAASKSLDQELAEGLSIAADAIFRDQADVDQEYAFARKEDNGAIDVYPRVIVFCAYERDVQHCLDVAKKHRMPFAARAGRHSYEGFSVVPNGMVIDVSRMTSVTIDRERMEVTVGAGTRLGDLASILSAEGLHTPNGAFGTVGLVGLTLSGGYGPTSKKYGLACDNLRRLRLITASGKVIVVDESAPDLLWAHRGGGGGNFGIVTSLTYQVYPMGQVCMVEIQWPVNKPADASPVLLEWQDRYTGGDADRNLGICTLICRNARTDVTSPFILGAGCVYLGTEEEARGALAPLLAIGAPFVRFRPCGYAYAVTNLLDFMLPPDADPDGPMPSEKMKSGYGKVPWTAAQFEALATLAIRAPNPHCVVGLEDYGGRLADVPIEATAFPHRDARWNLFMVGSWIEAGQREEALAWVEEVYGLACPWLSGQVYVGYTDLELGAGYKTAYYGPNRERLEHVKKQIDPDRFFTFPQGL